MAQLRDDYAGYVERNTEIIVIGPEPASAFRDYWEKNYLEFIGLPDPEHRVLKLYGQQVNLFKLGRMPAQVLVDRKGLARYAHYGHDMGDIPGTAEVFELLDEVNADFGESNESHDQLS
jgi:peroxiredoxin